MSDLIARVCIWILLWRYPCERVRFHPRYLEATGESTQRTEGYATAEAQYTAIELLKVACLDSGGDVVFNANYYAPSCKEVEGYFTCTQVAKGFCNEDDQ